MNERKWTTMATIGGTFERAQAEGLGLSRNLIRNLALSGEIPTVKVGTNTRLINWYVLMDYLYQGTPPKEDARQKDPGVLRRIEVR